MNRKIEYRAWDKTKKEMLSWELLCVNWSCGALKSNFHYSVMQYTGLKDKNGKEIYEGDIVKYDKGYFYEDNLFEVCFGLYDNGKSYEDYVGGHGYYFKVINGWLEESDVKEFEDVNVKIIGNIYSNPELLEANCNT